MRSFAGALLQFGAMPASSLRREYRAELDGLRAIAILAVLLFHAFPQLGSQGFAGVDAFFVLSGYLIGGVLRNPAISLTSFYAHRIRRIFPALALTLLGTLTIGWFLLAADEYRALGGHALAGAAFVPNFALMAETGYFDVAAHWKPLLNLWSLGVEEQFYILFPVLLAAGRRRFSVFSISFAITASSLVWVGIVAALTPLHSQASTLFFSPFCRFWEIGLGTMLVSAQSPTDVTRIRATLLFGTACLIAWTLAGQHLHGSVATAWAVALAVLATGWLVTTTGSPLHRLLSLPAPVYLGRISYPLYLWHWPVLVLGNITAARFDVRPPGWLLAMIAIPLSIALAMATYHLLERRIRYHPSRWVVPLLATALVGAGGLGGVISATDGIPARPAARPEFVAQTSWSWWNDARCASHLSLDAPCQISREQPEILLLGDSHANDLYPGIVELGAGGVIQVSTEFQAAVRPYVESFLAADTSIKTVVIGQFWENRGWDEAALEHVIWRGLKSGKRVILVLDATNLGTPGLARLTTYCKGSECSIDRRSVLSQQSAFRAATARLRAQHHRLEVIDPLDALCDGDTCWIARNGQLRLRDDNHLSLLGSRLVAALLKL